MKKLLLLLICVACTGARHDGSVSASDYENGTQKHPDLVNRIWEDVQDCMWGHLQKAPPELRDARVPVDSVVKAWHIMTANEQIDQKMCSKDGRDACWNRATKTIYLAAPQANSRPRLAHELMHAGQEAFGPWWSDTTAADPSHGEPAMTCAPGQ